jgi:hypothetical protein
LRGEAGRGLRDGDRFRRERLDVGKGARERVGFGDHGFGE